MPRRSGGTKRPVPTEESSRLPRWISPWSGRSSPAMSRKVVVLPQPLGPSRVRNSPALASRLRVVHGDHAAELLDEPRCSNGLHATLASLARGRSAWRCWPRIPCALARNPNHRPGAMASAKMVPGGLTRGRRAMVPLGPMRVLVLSPRLTGHRRDAFQAPGPGAGRSPLRLPGRSAAGPRRVRRLPHRRPPARAAPGDARRPARGRGARRGAGGHRRRAGRGQRLLGRSARGGRRPRAAGGRVLCPAHGGALSHHRPRGPRVHRARSLRPPRFRWPTARSSWT